MITYNATKDGDIISLTVHNERQATIYCSFLEASKTVRQDWLRPAYGSPKGTPWDKTFLLKFAKFVREHGFTFIK